MVCAAVYIQVITSRLMEQLSVPAVLLARQVYFPDMPLVRLLSLRVPCRSSVNGHHMTVLTATLKKKSTLCQKHHRGGLCLGLNTRSMLAFALNITVLHS